MLTFLTKPVFTPEEVVRAKEIANRALAPLSSTSRSSKGSKGSGYYSAEAEVRRGQLIKALNAGVDRLKAQVREKFKNLGYVSAS